MSIISNGLQLAGNVFRTSLLNKVLPGRLICSTGVQCKKEEVDPSKRRDREIPVETSIEYMKSDAYKETYQGQPVWKFYRRNYPGPYPPRQTRKTCIRGGVISTGSPCPICRDEYLVVDYRNIELLKQFISDETGSFLNTNVTGICRKKHRQLRVALHKAYDLGLITFDVPIIEYDYSDWYTPPSVTGSTVAAEGRSQKTEATSSGSTDRTFKKID